MQIVIVGAGGMGREVFAWLADAGHGDSVAGFLDDRQELRGATIAEAPVLGGLDWLKGHDDIAVALAIGCPAARLRALRDVDDSGMRLQTIVHPSAIVGPRVTIGDGSIVCPGVVLTCDITVGRAVILNYGTMVGHDGIIRDGAFIAPGVSLAGNVTVQRGAYIGIGASVIQGVTVGSAAVVGSGAAVVRDIPPGITAVGVPARPRT